VNEGEIKLTWIISVFLGLALTVFAYFKFWGSPLFDEFILIAVMISVFPPAVLDYVNYRWKRSIDEHLPELFRTIVQAQQTGMTLHQAIEEASKRDYGSLTKELKKMVAQISWGMTFEEALQALGRRVDTLLMRRTVPLIIEASLSGGRVERVFEPMGKFVQSTLILEKSRRTKTRPYIAIIYVAYFVFLLTIALLFKSFFAQMGGVPILGAALITPEAARQIFFHMSAIQAFFGGLVAGKMGEGTISAGLKHSLILMLCGYVVFKFII